MSQSKKIILFCKMSLTIMLAAQSSALKSSAVKSSAGFGPITAYCAEIAATIAGSPSTKHQRDSSSQEALWLIDVTPATPSNKTTSPTSSDSIPTESTSSRTTPLSTDRTRCPMLKAPQETPPKPRRQASNQ